MLVHDKIIISRACNEVEARSDPTAHAEMLCIQKGAKVLGNFLFYLHEIKITNPVLCKVEIIVDEFLTNWSSLHFFIPRLATP